MSDTHTWDVIIEQSAGEAIGNMVEEECTWETGPISPGNPISPACYVRVKNNGAGYGSINMRFYEYPNTSSEILLDEIVFTDVAPGEERAGNFHATAPNIEGTYPLGVKVWGDAEGEPSWGLSASKLQAIPEYVVPVIIIVGLLGMAYFAKK